MKTKSVILFLVFLFLMVLSINEGDPVVRKLLASISFIIGVIACREFHKNAVGSLDETSQF